MKIAGSFPSFVLRAVLLGACSGVAVVLAAIAVAALARATGDYYPPGVASAFSYAVAFLVGFEVARIVHRHDLVTKACLWIAPELRDDRSRQKATPRDGEPK